MDREAWWAIYSPWGCILISKQKDLLNEQMFYLNKVFPSPLAFFFFLGLYSEANSCLLISFLIFRFQLYCLLYYLQVFIDYPSYIQNAKWS